MSSLEEIEQNVMNSLKDFQQATVNRIDQLYRNGQKRILVCDEVGLGKTLIARGTIAKVAKIGKESGDKLIKVVYICSNAGIAEQNLNKLNIKRQLKVENISSSRLSMQHLNIFMQENDSEYLNNYIQLIPLTPDTSFRMTLGAGNVSERALMFAILKRLPQLADYEGELETAMENSAKTAWKDWAKNWYESQVVKCNELSKGKYLEYMINKLEKELKEIQKDGKSCMDMVIEMCNGEINKRETISKLRNIFAKISLDKLEPDLVIMDEFQRFKFLLNANPESETGMIANKFFYSNDVKMLLLSATPFKMYSTIEEIEEEQIDEHYSEFLNVMDFLNVTDKEKENFKTIWRNYSIKLKELTKGDVAVLEAKNAAEEAMYKNVCRTERISAVENADLIDDSDVKSQLEVLEQDIKSYMQAEKLLEDIGASFSIPVDYIKSTPYLMSFMRDYQLKREVEKYFKEKPEEIVKINKSSFWIKSKDIDKYEKIPNNNARLERVMNYTFKDSSELLLWVPPSKPYYEPKGVYENKNNFSKTLIFSSWEMIPRMVSGMLSYEAERKTVGKLAKNNKDKEAHYFYNKEKRYPSARMNFKLKDETPNAMNLFCLIYPSQFLTNCYKPIECMNKGMSLNEIEKSIKLEIKDKLEKRGIKIEEHSSSKLGKQDETWYYMAPLLLDNYDYVNKWLNSDEALTQFEDEEEGTKGNKGFIKHLELLKKLYENTNNGTLCNLGRMPVNLLDVLTDMAIASPAICINRAYQKQKIEFSNYLPSQFAKIFVKRMNTPEATAAVELACGKKTEEAHWQNMLTYCKYGNFQAMIDEYVHIINNGLDNNQDLINNMHHIIVESINIRTTNYIVDTFNNFKARINGKKERTTNIRSHFAVAFTKGDGREKDANRKKVIRNAFNSPFRPFVLASTSIGQEGLDFHNYCRRIVHWNLPANPIDIEQREGRINRFECLAIRQNVANRYGKSNFKEDIWKEMFNEAKNTEKTEGCSDLIPFWGLKESEDMVKIERIVPMYPFSRDENNYERLIKILSLYRLTLGQARQEELLEYILENYEDTKELHNMFINLSPFYRNNT